MARHWQQLHHRQATQRLIAGVSRPENRWPSLESSYGLVFPLPIVTEKILKWSGLIFLAAGVSLWLSMQGGSWQQLAGGIAIDAGGTLLLLHWVCRDHGGRIPFNPVTLLLGVYLIRRLLGLSYTLDLRDALVSPFEVIPTTGYLDASSKAELVTLLGTLAFVIGWKVARRRKLGAPLAIQTGSRQAKQLWLAYLLGTAVFLAEWMFAGKLYNAGTLLSTTAGLAYGAIFALLAFNDLYGTSSYRRWFVLAATIPLTANVLTSGMKFYFFTALFPVGSAYALKRPSRAFGLSALAVAGLLLFVFPYVNEYREANWGQSATGASPNEVAKSVMNDLEQEGAGRSASRSFESLQRRFGCVGEEGAVVYFSDKSGHLGLMFLRTLPYAFIPRFIWPAKPKWDASGWFTAYLAGVEYSENQNTSSTALHLATELYWMLGWGATFVGMLALGYLYRIVSEHLLRKGARAPVFLAAWYSFVMAVAFIEETRFNPALVMPFIVLVNTYVLQGIVSFFSPYRIQGTIPSRNRAHSAEKRPSAL